MSQITELLCQANAGDEQAVEQLMQQLYGELKQLAVRQFAHERYEHSLQPSALVNEAYLRLISKDGQLQTFENRAHFFSSAAEAMRRILIDSARRHNSLRRGGRRRRQELHDAADDYSGDSMPDTLLDLDEGLQRLAEVDTVSAELIKLRVFAGLSVAEAGKLLGISRSAAYQNWQFARSWFSLFFNTDGSMLDEV